MELLEPYDMTTKGTPSTSSRSSRVSDQIRFLTAKQPYGFKASGRNNQSGEIESVGSAPWGVEKFDAAVTLKLSGAAPVKVTACDEQGYPTEKEVQTTGPAAAFRITLNESSPYHVLER